MNCSCLRSGRSKSGITADSRRAQPGSLFVAVAGTKADGAAYVKDAVAKGAVAVVSGHPVDADVPVLSVTDPRLYLSLAASRFYGKQPEIMVAVTGTAERPPLRPSYGKSGLSRAMPQHRSARQV